MQGSGLSNTECRGQDEVKHGVKGSGLCNTQISRVRIKQSIKYRGPD